MAILFQTTFGVVDDWLGALSRLLPDEEFRVWPDVGDRGDIDIAIVWDIAPSELAGMANLEAILVLGAGVSHLDFAALPDVPVARLADTSVARDIATYVAHWVLHHHRHLDRYAEQQRGSRWQRHPYEPAHEYTVGICGMGNIGRHIADVVGPLGYRLTGWSRSGRQADGVEVFAEHGLRDFLAGCDLLVNVLPLTPDTRRLLNAERLGWLPAGAVVVNVGRGGTIDDDALVEALDTGHLRAAVLDVFRGEPLGPDSRFWSHPRVTVTPHISGSTFPRSAARYLADNVARVRAGQVPEPLVDPARGY